MGIPNPGGGSDLAFVARMVEKTRSGDQVTRQEAHRLHEIAENGYTVGGVPPSDTPSIIPDVSEGVTRA